MHWEKAFLIGSLKLIFFFSVGSERRVNMGEWALEALLTSGEGCPVSDDQVILNARFSNLRDLMPEDLRWSWSNSNRNKVHNKCDVLESSPKHHPAPSMEKLSSIKPVPGAKKVGNHCIYGEENPAVPPVFLPGWGVLGRALDRRPATMRQALLSNCKCSSTGENFRKALVPGACSLILLSYPFSFLHLLDLGSCHSTQPREM